MTNQPMTISELFKAFRTARGITQKELAERVNKMPNCQAFSAQNYASIEAGKTQRTGFLLEIAKALNIPLELLANPPLQGQAINFDNPEQSTSTAHFIPVLNYDQVADYLDGKPIKIEQWQAVDNNITTKAAAIIVEGFAMAPLFEPNDIAIIDPTLAMETEAPLFVKLPDDSFAIRYLQREGKTLYLTPMITNLPNAIQPLNKSTTVYGTVIKVIKTLKK